MQISLRKAFLRNTIFPLWKALEGGIHYTIRCRQLSRDTFNDPIRKVFLQSELRFSSDGKPEEVFDHDLDLFVRVPVHGKVARKRALETHFQKLGLRIA